MATKMRSVLLSSAVIRKSLDHRKNDGAFARAFLAIDRMGQLHDALEALHSTPDPNMTKAARALKYRGQYEAAMSASRAAAMAAVDGLSELEAQLVRAAEERAGLHAHVPESAQQEIRAALRSLTMEERNAVIRQAAQTGDANIIKAVRDAASPLLVGPYTVPLAEMIQVMVEKASPELAQARQDIEAAVSFVTGATGAFTKAAAEMRDPAMEAEAERQAAVAKAAEAALAQAITAPAQLPTE